MSKYTAITFAPVQGFIEKSRKLRDLYGASQILSYLSQRLMKEAEKTTEVISPALINVQQGMPNRILLKGEFSETQARETLLSAWKHILFACRNWIEEELPGECHWEQEWRNWGNNAWEVFRGTGETISAAMEDLESQKLSHNWVALNWIGESSSLTGTDGIAFPRLGAQDRNPNNRQWKGENEEIKDFYRRLSCISENLPVNGEPEGKYVAPNEKLSIPELVKRLVTRPKIATNLEMSPLGDSFSDIYRRPKQITEQKKGRWTGWFMGDGDKVGDHLKTLAREKGDAAVTLFSHKMRQWGNDFAKSFQQELGRVIYAGGDDFLGVIYSGEDKEAIQPERAYTWLLELPQKWLEHGQDINLSVGFVWAAASVPQREILQHCRESQKVAKSLGRDRVTIRVVFNSGQYVEWTCPWDDLGILRTYRDRDRKTYWQWQNSSFDRNQQPNWNHIYSDLAQLTARHAFNLNRDTYNVALAIKFLEIYFPDIAEKLGDYDATQKLVGFSDDTDGDERAQATVEWICNLIKVGWYLCSNI